MNGLNAVNGYPTSDWTSGASEIAFHGYQADINSALSSLQYLGTSTGLDSVTISTTLYGAAYNPANQHYYDFINGSFTWEQARADASISSSTFLPYIVEYGGFGEVADMQGTGVIYLQVPDPAPVSIEIYSSNDYNSGFARVGDVVTVNFVMDRSISQPTVVIAGENASVSGRILSGAPIVK